MKGVDALIVGKEKPVMAFGLPSFIIQEGQEEDDGDTTLIEDQIDETLGPGSRPENGMQKVVIALDSPDPPSPPGIVPRSASFPAKLLARRRSSSAGSPQPTVIPVRRSEILSGGYFRRALRTLRGEDPEGRIRIPQLSAGAISIQPPFSKTPIDEFHREIRDRQAAIERYLAEIDPATLEDERRSSIDSMTTAHSDGFVFDSPSPGWSTAEDIDAPGFDVYYERYRYGSDDEDDVGEDELEEFSSPAAHLPHIRVTSH